MKPSHLSRAPAERILKTTPRTKTHLFPVKEQLFSRPLADTALLVHTTKLDTTPLKPRKHKKGLALPPNNNVFKRETYRVGDGDPDHQPVRVGADDHLRHLSTTSAGSAVYAPGHV